MKKVFSLLIAMVLLVVLCACSSEPTLVDSNNAPVATPTIPSAKTFKLGDSVELDDTVVTFLDVIKSTGSSYNKPEEGNVFLLCEFEIVNNSSEELAVSSMLSFEAYCDDYSCDSSFSALMEKGNKEQLDGTIAAGKKMKGVIGFEVPENWGELEIRYTPDILSSNKIVFIATNN